MKYYHAEAEGSKKIKKIKRKALDLI